MIPPQFKNKPGSFHRGLAAVNAGGLPRPRRGQRVFLLASFLDKPQFREATREAVRKLSRRHELVRRDAVPQIRTWEFRR